MLRRLFTLLSALSLALSVFVALCWLLAAIYPRQFVRRPVWREGVVIREQLSGFGWDGWGFVAERTERHAVFGQPYGAGLRLTRQPTPDDL